MRSNENKIEKNKDRLKMTERCELIIKNFWTIVNKSSYFNGKCREFFVAWWLIRRFVAEGWMGAYISITGFFSNNKLSRKFLIEFFAFSMFQRLCVCLSRNALHTLWTFLHSFNLNFHIFIPISMLYYVQKCLSSSISLSIEFFMWK